MRRALLPLLLLPALVFAASRAEEDAMSLGRYLTAEEIHDVVVQALPEFEACYTHSSARGRVMVGEVFVDFTIDPSGEVSDARLRSSRSELADLDGCLLDQARALRFRPHDEAPLDVGYPFVYRDAALQPYPMVFLKLRELPLLFFHLPEDPEAREALLRALSG
ncbi:MAG: TonB family protein [Alphaproteobacteria bacterium]|nr:TonB family protein [Alphaproteobacteria bacterium]